MIIRDLNGLAWHRDDQGHDVKDAWPGCQLLLVSGATRLAPAHDLWLLVLRGEGEMTWGHALLSLQGGVMLWVDAASGIELRPRPDGDMVVMLVLAHRDSDRPRDKLPPDPAALAETQDPALINLLETPDDPEDAPEPPQVGPQAPSAVPDAPPDPLSAPPSQGTPPTPAPPLRWTVPPG